MAPSINDQAVETLVRETCLLTGESLTSAIEIALRERLERLASERFDDVRRVVSELHDLIAEHDSGNPVTYHGFDEELWDADGLPA
ncbi:MAG: type II toxin-antitoxin system VapB family antitoxin [Actinomycetales bacterium]|nr:type II toxin-antitoxin system VapB family antitoxin [Actinomycetales bacterium]